MSDALKRSFLWAIPLEAINLAFVPFPVDVGFDAFTPWYWQALGYRWLFFHYPGLVLLNLVGDRYPLLILFVTGYIEMALLILAILRLRHLIDSRRPQAAQT